MGSLQFVVGSWVVFPGKEQWIISESKETKAQIYWVSNFNFMSKQVTPDSKKTIQTSSSNHELSPFRPGKKDIMAQSKTLNVWKKIQQIPMVFSTSKASVCQSIPTLETLVTITDSRLLELLGIEASFSSVSEKSMTLRDQQRVGATDEVSIPKCIRRNSM